MSRPNHSLLKVAVGIIINDQHQVLVALRPSHNPHGGLWEFPGGKFELNESPFDALKRELHEEIGITLNKATPMMCVEHDYGKVRVALDTWHIEDYDGTPYGREGQTIRWVNHTELSQLVFPEGNKAIVDAVKEIL
ncbi:MAG TPA: 8-oxo-dGTP diphosphatase MutT [Gammaproteobacteria bacterium]|nr:8-oxo-dGTP diphosphatase MutT [Gammaproteobacteria bacterium]